MSREQRIALYECSSSRATWYDTYKTTEHRYIAVSVAQGKEIVSVPVDPKEESFAVIARADGRDHLLVLIDGMHLSVYPLDPKS